MSDVRIAKTFSELLKFNPYHDSRGRFTTAGGATSFTYAPGRSKAHDLAIAREKERTAALAAVNPKEEKGFKPAATKEEAIEYAQNKLGMTSVEYGNLDVETINHINQEISAIQDKYPELKEFATHIDKDGRNGVYAAASVGYDSKGKLFIGQKKYGEGIESVKESYQKDVDSGFHPAGTDYKSIIWHEYGHLYAYSRAKTGLGFNSSESLGFYDRNDYFKAVKSRSFEKNALRDAAKSMKITQKEFKSRISRYAEKNPAETFAEAFAEFNTSPNPRPECIALMKAAGVIK